MRKSFFKISIAISFIICLLSGFSMAAVTGQSNNPLITGEMIPVKWDGLNWIVTDEFDIEWYDYTNNKWANVMLKDGLSVEGISNVNSVTLEEIKGKRVVKAGSMFVWVPRYTYKIDGDAIDIKWSKGIKDNISNGFNRLPAFFYGEYLGGNSANNGLNRNENFTNRNGTANELTGIWVAKFMAGNNNGEVIVLPGYSFYKGSFSNLFELAKTIDGGADATSHMMKASEWAAVAYLTKGFNNSVYINNYSGEKTGFGGYSENATASNSSYEWNSENGVFASNTNNVYGIYDLSGGVWEYVAGFIGERARFLELNVRTDNFKDVDLIKSIANFGGLALNDTKGWNSDYYTGLTAGDIIVRGGDKSLTTKAGMFAYSVAHNNDVYGFRPVIAVLPSEDKGSLSLIESEATVIEGDYTVVNVHFTSNLSWNVKDLKENVLSRAEIRVQYTSDELITSISGINPRITSIENLDTKEIITLDETAGPGNYLMKVEIGGSDAGGNPVFMTVENSECKIVINSLKLKNTSDEEVVITGIDLNKVRVSVYDGSGVIPDITGIEVNPAPDRVNYAYRESSHSDLDLTGGRINIITPGRNVTKVLKEEDIAGLIQRDTQGNIIKVVIKNQDMLEKLTEELKNEISDYTPIVTNDIINQFNNDTLGSFEVIVEYGGFTDTFIVNITDEFYTLSVVADPNVAVKAISSGGKFEKGENISISFNRNIGYKFVQWVTNKAGVTIGNPNSSSTYIIMPDSNVTVTAKFKEVKKIEVIKTPNKTEYAKGSRLDLTGGEIKVTYDDGSTEIKSLTSNDIATNPYNGSILNDITMDKVTVTYEGKETEFGIEIRENFILTLKVKYPKIGTVSGAGSKEEKSQFQIRAGIYEQYYNIYKYMGCICTDTDTGEELNIVSEKEGMTENDVYLKLLPTENRTYPAELMMPARNITIIFNFEEPVKVTYNTDGKGYLQYATDLTKTYSSIVQEIINGGSTLEVVAHPFDGYRFVKWSDNKTVANRFDENVTQSITYTAQFEEAYWNIIYKNCQGEVIKTVNNVRDKSEITDIPNCNLEAHRAIGWIDEATGQPINFGRIGRDGVIPNKDELVIKLVCDIPRIIFTPEDNNTTSTLIQTNITGINIDNSSLEYIINENNTEVISGEWDYTSGSFYEVQNASSKGWYLENATLSAYTGNMFRSANSLGNYIDSNSEIVINTSRVFENISFKYLLSASSDSAIGITVNGKKIAERTENTGGWLECKVKANSIDGKIIIGLTYSKGASAGGSDIAAIRDLKVDRTWTKITNPKDLNILPVANGDNFIFARAYDNTVERNLISAVSGSFKGINLLGDINLDGVVDNNDYTKLFTIIYFDEDSTQEQKEKSDVDLNGVVNSQDLVELEKILDKETYYLVYCVDGENEVVVSKAPGDSITLAAEENADRSFIKWTTEGITDNLTGTEITFTMPSNNVFVGAEFDYTKDYILTTNLSGVMRESMLVREGEIVELTAQESNGRVFSSWSSEGIAINSTNKTIEFIMPDNDVTVVANFELPSYTLTTYTDGIEKTVTAKMGEIITVTAETTAGRTFGHFDIVGLNEKRVKERVFTFTMPSNNVKVISVFAE